MKKRMSFNFGLTACFRVLRSSAAWMTRCLAVCMLGLIVPVHAQKPAIITFDAPGAGTDAGQGTNPWAITPQGAIIGWYVDGDNAIHGFMRTHQGAFTRIDASGADIDASNGTFPTALNAEGVSVGAYLDAAFVFHGLLRTPDGKSIRIDDPYAGTNPGTGTRVVDINAAGTITGWSDDADNVNHVFLRDVHGGTTEFYAPGAGTDAGQGTYMPTFYGLDAAGAIIGWYVDADNVMHGYLRLARGTVTEFDAPGAGVDSSVCEGAPVPPGSAPLLTGTQPLSLNPEGVVVGQYGDVNCAFHGFLRGEDGRITRFDVSGAGTSKGQGTFVLSNNPAGKITGYYVDGSNVAHGFVRSKDGEFTTFDAPGAGTGTLQGTFPFGNNPAGAIVGNYVDASGAFHGFLRNP